MTAGQWIMAMRLFHGGNARELTMQPLCILPVCIRNDAKLLNQSNEQSSE